MCFFLLNIAMYVQFGKVSMNSITLLNTLKYGTCQLYSKCYRLLRQCSRLAKNCSHSITQDLNQWKSRGCLPRIFFVLRFAVLNFWIGIFLGRTFLVILFQLRVLLVRTNIVEWAVSIRDVSSLRIGYGGQSVMPSVLLIFFGLVHSIWVIISVHFLFSLLSRASVGFLARLL